MLIGAQSRVRASRLGPYVSIGDNCSVVDCDLADCQVYNGTSLHGVTAREMLFDAELRFDANGIVA